MFVQQVMQHTTEALKDKELLLATSARIYIPFVELGVPANIIATICFICWVAVE